MGVAEYWRFSPSGTLVGARRSGERLEGSALVGLGYEALESRADGSIRSGVLGLDVRIDNRRGLEHLLRLRDPETGEDLLTFRESEQGRLEAERERLEAERALRAEARARQAAEAENARLKARIEALEARHAPGKTDGKQ